MSGIKAEILGTGCKKCHQLEANMKEALTNLNLEGEVNHITDPMQIAERGVMKTPALVINDQVVTQGKVLNSEELQPYLKG
ncbi:MAG: thioredoxin family protein [Halothece sp.]